MATLSRSEDAELVRAIASGAEAALGRAYDLHGGLVYGLALRILRNTREAEEVLQDVFVQLWRGAERFDAARGSLATYLAAVARSRSIDRLRSRRAMPGGFGSDADADKLAAGGPPPAGGAIAAEERAHVAKALEGLPAEERRVVDLAYFEGLSQSEIAERTGTPLGTVKSRARSALRRLKSFLPASLGGES